MIKLQLSVHQLVDFLTRTGDIDDRIFNNATMAEGVRIHSYYQGKQGNEYLSEVPLKYTFISSDYEITLEGRADGVIITEDLVIIDEIKSTIDDINDFYKANKNWHLSQAKCYALMYALTNGLDEMGISLTYIHQVTKEEKIKKFNYSVASLEKDIDKLLREFIDFYNLVNIHKERRDEIMKSLPFPFENYRKGQYDLSKYCYKIARDGGILFANAPTGIGKTMSTLFPFTKMYSKEESDKIFYLTAKNSGRESAYKAASILNQSGGCLNGIIISAKDKICPNKEASCNVDECPLAKDYYTKLKDVIYKTLISDEKILLTSQDVLKIALENNICPFELSLDLSLYLDLIICDYNYLFDPNVYFRRYFEEERTSYLALIDEAHNLVDRGRNMYSATISLNSFNKMKASMRHFAHKKLKNSFTKINNFFKSYEDLEENEKLLTGGELVDLSKVIESFLQVALDVSKNYADEITDEYHDFYLSANRFYKLLEYFDENFAFYYKKENDNISFHIFCLNPSSMLSSSLNKLKGAVMFSGTLSPISYYKALITNDLETPYIKLQSPFKREQLKLIIAPHISIKYKDRDRTLIDVVNLIKVAVTKKVGNYFIYVPSYEYLSKIRPYLEEINDISLLVQERDMSESEKEQFLSIFVDNPTTTTVGLAITGGAFSEGIDLVSDRLIGVIIVGIGLPQICFERDLIREYYDFGEEKLGYNYAYRSPGINKVMQAIGRVIRSEEDKGFALLIDERYINRDYRDALKEEYGHYSLINNEEELSLSLDKFYKVQAN